MKNEILEGNKLIAEFMGVRWNNEPNSSSGTQFHSSWDWLMPVVEKARELVAEKMMNPQPDDEFKDLDDASGWRSWSYRQVHLSTDISKVWKLTVEFIKWYNQNSNTVK